MWCEGPTTPFASFSSPNPSSRRPKPQGYLTKSYSRLCGAENTREKRALRRAGIRRGNSLREGEIDAIVTDIELDIITITIIIISTIITAVITAGHHMASSINFNQFLEKEKLKSNGSNFTDWFRHVRIFLNGGNLQYVLDAPLGDPPAETETDEVKAVYATRKTRYSQVQCAILCSLEADLQKRFEHHDPHELINELKTIFETHAAVECYEASKHFFSCMMEEGSSVSEHMLAMTGHAKKLSDLGIVIPNRLGINRVLQSLPPSYKNFVMNYNMQNMNKELPELFSMLKSAEIEIKKEHQVLMVNKTTSFKKQGKSKGKNKKSGKKAATPPVKPKTGPKPDAECYYCKEKGHWKHNCSKYLADLKSGLVKKKKEGISDIHVIDVYLTGSRTSTWVFDTGSVAHICNSKQELKNKRRLLKDEVTMRVGNGSKVDVIAVGTLPLHLPSGLVLSLNNCYFVPALSMNIISGSCLMQDGYSFKSENNGCSIFMNNIFYGRAPEKNGLFLLDLDSSDTHIHNIDAKRIKLNDNSTYMWHCRLGHIGVKRMKKLHTDGLLESLDFESLDRCEACLMGKMTKTPFSGIMERATDLLEIIHTDVCGPMSVASRGGYRYVLTFTDDLSRYGYIYFMKHKSETFEKFKEFQSEVENQRNKKIKFLRSDRGGEYLSYEFGMHLKKCGILSQLTPPGTPQRNGVSERRNRTLLDMVRSMMSLTDLPLSFWSYALETAAFTLNRAPSKSVETTPYELWFNKKPKLSFLKVWGCEAYVKKLQPDKLEPKAEKCVFIGYPKETIGYTFYHRSEGKIFVAKNGTFLEKEFLTKEVTGRKVELDEIEESLLVDQSSAVPEDVPVPPAPATEEANDNDHETSNEIATEPRRSTRERATPDWYDPCLNVMIVDNNDEDPATYEEAMMSPDSNKWQEAIKSEMGSMYDNKVWTLVDLPDSRKAVENKWIFKRKTDADGNITVYKARLVAKGFRQIQGVDYDETFSPVAKLKSVRILLAIAAFFDYEIWQMDVKTAFLNGDIEEELYMVQPKGFVDPKNADKVCKLQRSIYGLKQASRSWNRRFDKVIKDFGFIQCHGEACIYKKVSGSSVAFLILYVDDILLIGNDIELLSSVKGYLNNSFSMKDLGEASYILGIKIYRDRSRRLIGLSQSTYLDKILKKFRMDESKKGFLPMLPGKVLSKTQGPATAEERERMSQIPYASAVGSIMYAMLCTRPDIAHAVSLTSRYQSDPGMEHWTAVKNILKYLKRTKDMFLCYGGDQELVVTSYTDASWNTDPDDSKSQSGYVFILNGAAVSWASSKQCTVAKSSTESEYIAEASSEAVWMKRFIVELGVVPSALDPLVIYCDNMGAIANAQEPRSHKRLKHIKLRYHSIREYIEDGEVKICKVHTDLNIADPLTKALPRAKHDQHQNAMGVRLDSFADDTSTRQLYSTMIRPCFLPVGMSTSNRIIKPGYESYQPVVAARQFGLGQVSPHFFLHHLTESRADLPDILTGQRCYSFFDALAIPIPHNLSFTSSTDGFETWWSMWKTHAFRRALGPLLKQLDAEYDIPAEQQQDGPEPVHDDGSPFKFLPPAPVVLFCKNSPPLKKVVMQSQPISPKSASKSRVSSRPAAPRASAKARTAVRKVAARKTLKRQNPTPAQESLHTSTEENSSEETQSSRRDSSSGNSGKTTTQSQPDLPPSASKKRSAPEPAASQAPIKAGQGGLRTKSRCIKRARKEPQTSSSNQEVLNTDDTSSGEVEEVLMPSATLDLATSKSVADKVANLAKPTAETQEPITSSSAVPLVLGESYDLSRLLTFDPESIEPATSKASEESGPSATRGQLQHLDGVYFTRSLGNPKRKV
ncbi:hypothetical protein QYE76_029335 [Lolium multiflorum]|uniref:Gag-pol polyprotein n=1 Tax=Lolium multiflorum TaxID=4521 RepID=A0AAD8QNF3_LOLMU|nr:hypothetical protein QYE76_029335 [Lolium multiflorum]